ncbi:Rhamnosyltransferase [Sphingobium herbicidovorans NBRC 16415]|uniref:Rhamnosyltransferase n=1 Tax=Sphingobium herbicidovorans (strain ATCC 700291 / DSM 11019 / CCUG 56400 / KCTC 2939 / LMG 18315 / NBRC 16415 / MH) TaxID=1219045 RepID=A0A086PET3_SPHHM|nr:ferritin-like domain-containing protein [Sphingobium herbicidovorans]KFG91901.1 Rhamnosyltransferase [Sphingobium herbicidovorans NBRC 16415]
MSLPAEIESVGSACAHVLATADPLAKLMAARAVARAWRLGCLTHRFDAAMPDRPARPDAPQLLPPNQMPKRGRIGSDRARAAMIHALAHIEFVAIDLAFDLIGRFGAEFPRAFVDDWVRVGAEEAMHFAMLDRRLQQMGSRYGDLPAHDGLWQAASETAHDAMARLAIVPMVLEARALDITPATIQRFEGAGDLRTARILQRIMTDEIRHVSAGTTWFGYATSRAGLAPENHYQILVKRHFRGALKPPFNDSARRQAGLTLEFYSALAQ